MLEPDDRRHLLEALRPPEGYALDCAIGTTFSLDLLTLLTVPLAFTLFDWQDEAGRPAADPLAVLEALRRHADRIHLFCQAGRIAVPQADRLLYGYLENSVFQVNAPNPSGVFHPKVWVLRFTAPEARVSYRLLCLSRNLTFDRCWDTILRLDGELLERRNAIAVNRPLSDFVAALPAMTVTGALPEHVTANVRRLADELLRVKFEPPEGMDLSGFWPLGIEGYRKWPFQNRTERLLVVSPFLSPGCLDRLTEQGNDHILVSRLESLAELTKKELAGFKRLYYLNPAAETEEPEADTTSAPVDPLAPLSGLHAKLFVADDGWNTRIWTGSANATEAAFGANVEFLVELVGKRSAFGVEAFLRNGNDSMAFIDLLQPYTPAKEAASDDPVMKRLEFRLETVRRQLSRASLQAHVSSSATPETYRVELRAGETVAAASEVQVLCWPITLAQVLGARTTLASDCIAAFEPVSFEALTAFYAFELSASEAGQTATCRFVLHAPLIGAPEDRRERLLRSLLQNKDQLLRFLMFILAEGSADEASLLAEIHRLGAEGSAGKARGAGAALFESLVQALSRNPAKLDQIAHLVTDLRQSEQGQQLLPMGFEAIWEPIWAARQRLRP